MLCLLRMRSLHLSYWLALALAGWILLALSTVTGRSRLRKSYAFHFPETPRERLFLAFVGFFVTIAVVRTLTWCIHNGIGPIHNLELRGRHIHHLVCGIILLLLVGYGWLIDVGGESCSSVTWSVKALSMVYGVGAALTLCEFALWLNMRDVYWEREGRESVQAIFLFGALLGIGIFGRSFLLALAREFVKLFKSRRS